MIELLASEKYVESSGSIPAVCDFTRHEVRSISPKTGGKPWKALRRAEESNLCIVWTGFIEYGEPTDRLLGFKDYIDMFKKSYIGVRSRSNKGDLALYVTALYLRSLDVKVEVATIDKTLWRALESAGLTVYVRPWTL